MASNSVFLHNTACPKCRESGRDRDGNNLGVYSDGHCHCWSCGYYQHADPTRAVRRLSQSETSKEELDGRPDSGVVLPSDADTYIPAVGRDWLGLYSITTFEIISNRIMWSEYWQQLIFPYFDKYNNLLGWQGRNFNKTRVNSEGRTVKVPRWYSQGDMKKIYHIMPFADEYERIVVVEDIVSAIKVSRHAPCMPLFGSQVGLERFVRLSKLCGRVSLWLDYDKRTEALLESRRSLVPCDVIITELDPKEYDDEKIRGFLS
jgi:hypothetical protein